MKPLLCFAVLIALSGCSIHRGFSDQLPRLNSPSAKSVADYSTCLQEKWRGLGAEIRLETSKKDDVVHVYGLDHKAGLRERADLAIGLTGTGTQVLLYEIQAHRPYALQYRDAAIGCL